jgi:hypothetical protein
MCQVADLEVVGEGVVTTPPQTHNFPNHSCDLPSEVEKSPKYLSKQMNKEL